MWLLKQSLAANAERLQRQATTICEPCGDRCLSLHFSDVVKRRCTDNSPLHPQLRIFILQKLTMESQPPTSAIITKKCYLAEIEAEVLLIIATQVPDLLSLHNLVHASPTIFRLFEVYGLYITECVCANDPMPGQFIEMIRAIAHIRSGTLPTRSLDSFSKEVMINSQKRAYLPETYEDLLASLPKRVLRSPLAAKILEMKRKFGLKHHVPFIFPSLPKNVSPRVLRGILLVVWQISRLTPACLQHYLGRLMAHRPQHLIDERICYDCCCTDGRSDEIKVSSPPSWLEEQRVVLNFWRIRIFYDLKLAGEKGLLGWPKEDIEELRHSHPSRIFDPIRHLGFMDGFETVLEYLQDVRGYKRITNPDDMDFPSDLPHLDVKLGWPIPSSSPRLQRQISRRAGITTVLYDFFNDQNSPLYLCPYTPFRRLGFAIWDEERLCAVGLDASPDSRGRGFFKSQKSAWYSLLTEKEKRDLQNIRDRKEELRLKRYESRVAALSSR